MDGFDEEIVETIHRVLNQVSLFVEIFLRAGEFIRNQDVLTARLANQETPRVDLQKNYHPPCKELAANLLGDSMGAERDIILHQKGGRLQQIKERRPAYSPVYFPCCSNVVNQVCTQQFRIKLTPQAVAATELHVVRIPPTDSESRSKDTQCCVALQDYFFARFPHYRNACAQPAQVKILRHVNTDSRIKQFQVITSDNLRTCTHSPHMSLFSYSFSIPPSARPIGPF